MMNGTNVLADRLAFADYAHPAAPADVLAVDACQGAPRHWPGWKIKERGHEFIVYAASRDEALARFRGAPESIDLDDTPRFADAIQTVQTWKPSRRR